MSEQQFASNPLHGSYRLYRAVMTLAW